MNKEEFDRQVADCVCNRYIDPFIISKWYKSTVDLLKAQYTQEKNLSHPRHRGDAREDALTNVLRDLLPPIVSIEKGYAIDRNSGSSREQDCMLCNQNALFTLMKTDTISYVPIDCVLASIEIKSKLSKEELKKSILNCISLKSVAVPYDKSGKYENIPSMDSIPLYAIFAYDTDLSLEDIRKALEEANTNVPLAFQINMIYVLDQGIVLPIKGGKLSIGVERPPVPTGKYQAIGGSTVLKAPELDHALPFLLFVSNILDATIGKKKETYNPRSYILGPIITKSVFDNYMQNSQSTEQYYADGGHRLIKIKPD